MGPFVPNVLFLVGLFIFTLPPLISIIAGAIGRRRRRNKK